MRIFKRILTLVILLVIIGGGIALYLNYPKLDIITGYSSKSHCSCTYVARRPEAFTDSTDNNFSPVNLASDRTNRTEETASASLFGLKKRTAQYIPGLGCILMPPGKKALDFSQRPRRSNSISAAPYPYGNGAQKDTTFPEIDYKKLNASIDAAFSDNHLKKTRAVLVVYKDRIIGEKYAPGFDETSLHLGWSMTKSITATLYGILQEEGMIDIANPAPVASWQNDNRKHITYNDLLQMSSGLAWEEDYSRISDVTKMLFTASDMSAVAENKELLHEPGTHFYYSSGTTNLLSGLLKQEIGNLQEYLNFPYQMLIDRIGMHSMVLETDASGTYVGSSYSWATARDWAKFGLLYLHKGNWNGDRIFAESWADYVSTSASDSEGTYGAQFWLNESGVLPDVPRDTYFADGYQGQRVYVIPSKDLVVVRMGITDGNYFDFNEFTGGITNAIQ
ncbi:serine hydrolase domain-containing protein [Robertkochia sediminum]|uniref:serine hydrolase domain-containing protein n=1 Tax=Robertkochia sediminum TaxID=2785326 RepID=UPI0019347A15|nr:serine hydrolase [Robertkochia sediminum]MBL7471823.1 serine hydrolase [Robertkochia sediminum]